MTMTEADLEAPARNVTEALNRVVRDLPGIGKDQKADPAQGGYAYRGIEDITRKVQPLLARHGVVFVPKVLTWERDEIQVREKPWTDDRMQIVYTVYGPGGAEDSIEVGPIPCVGRDNSDKGTNKCMTQAFKYALLQVLCISDANDDADGTTHEADSGSVRRTTSSNGVGATDPQRRAIERIVTALGDPPAWMFTEDLWPVPEALTKAQASTIIDRLNEEPVPPKAERRSTLRTE